MPRWIGVALVVAALIGGALVPAQPAAMAGSARPTTPAVASPDRAETAASVQARRLGHRVEVLDHRDETTTQYANPDGSYTLEQSIRPVRVRQGGGWAPVDTRLHRSPDGSISPDATSFTLGLSGGRGRPLVSLGDGDRQLALTWPGSLPAPVLEGDAARYPEVLPGVDLVVRATDTGFAEVLVVKTAVAAANPALARIRFGATARGVTLRAEPSGGFVAVDDAGAPVFVAPQPIMWDSSGADPDPGARLRGPGQEARRSIVATAVTRDAVVLEPDRHLLMDPNTRFPVYVDPSVSVGKLAWAEVWKQMPTFSDFNPSHEAMVGFENDPCCPPNDTVRAFWRLDTAKVNGKHVLHATFRTHEWWAWSCQARTVEVWWTGSISTATTWNNQSWIEKQATANTAKRRGDPNCGEGDVEFNVTGIVQRAANGRWADLTLGMKAANETDPFGWKKFNNNPVIAIDYNSVPNVPSGLTIASKACGSGTWVGTRTPTMSALVSDPDAGQLLSASLYWATSGGQISETNKVVQSNLANGGRASMAVPVGALADGGSYYWQGKTIDGTDTSGLSGQCAFNVDVSPPAQPPAVSSADYPADGNFHGGVGRTGSFSLSAAGVADVVAYRYGLADPPTTEVAAQGLGGNAIVAATPSAVGLTTLFVQSVDRAGNLSAITRYTFLVGGPTDPAGQWISQPESGGALQDASGNGHTATLVGTTSRTTARDGTPSAALHLDGASGYAATAGPVAATDRSFAVAAWVRLASTANYATVLCQEGNVNSGMLLQYDKGGDRWALAAQSNDGPGGTATRAKSSQPPRVGVWTHLAGTYDAASGTLSLYVNGVLSGTASARISWNAGGRLLIGAEKFNASIQSYFPGDVADVRVWDRLVYPDELKAIASATTLAGQWPLDGDGADLSGLNHPVTPAGGVSWSGGFNGVGGVTLDGTGSLSTAAPVVLTDQSFSVAAWVRVTDTGGFRTAVCQQGNRTCSFFLQYDKVDNRWAFSLCPSDVDNPACTRVTSPAAPTLGVWTHLVGVYDAGAQTARLYVNGQQVNGLAVGPVFNAAGPLKLGGAKYNGGAVDPWVGDLDGVSIYLGVLTDDQIVALFNQ
jgi:hypothetical protein